MIAPLERGEKNKFEIQNMQRRQTNVQESKNLFKSSENAVK